MPSKSRSLIPFLKKLGLKQGQLLYDMGSGDGTVLKHATKTLGLRSIGVELNPYLVMFSRLRLLPQRKLTKVIYGDQWKLPIPSDVDVVYAFILPKYMTKLEKKLKKELQKPTLVVTYSFELPGHEPVKRSGGFIAYDFQPLAKK